MSIKPSNPYSQIIESCDIVILTDLIQSSPLMTLWIHFSPKIWSVRSSYHVWQCARCLKRLKIYPNARAHSPLHLESNLIMNKKLRMKIKRTEAIVLSHVHLHLSHHVLINLKSMSIYLIDPSHALLHPIDTSVEAQLLKVSESREMFDILDLQPGLSHLQPFSLTHSSTKVVWNSPHLTPCTFSIWNLSSQVWSICLETISPTHELNNKNKGNVTRWWWTQHHHESTRLHGHCDPWPDGFPCRDCVSGKYWGDQEDYKTFDRAFRFEPNQVEGVSSSTHILGSWYLTSRLWSVSTVSTTKEPDLCSIHSSSGITHFVWFQVNPFLNLASSTIDISGQSQPLMAQLKVRPTSNKQPSTIPLGCPHALCLDWSLPHLRIPLSQHLLNPSPWLNWFLQHLILQHFSPQGLTRLSWRISSCG